MLDALLVALGLPVLLPSGYLGVLTLASGKPSPPTYGEPRRKFRFVVPAHDEEQGIGATVRKLFAGDYPPELFEVWVGADNCSDATAARARDAGATVLERAAREP